MGRGLGGLNFRKHTPGSVLFSYRLKSTYEITSVADPDSVGSLDPDPDSQSGSGSRRAKMIHKNRKKLRNLIF